MRGREASSEIELLFNLQGGLQALRGVRPRAREACGGAPGFVALKAGALGMEDFTAGQFPCSQEVVLVAVDRLIRKLPQSTLSCSVHLRLLGD